MERRELLKSLAALGTVPFIRPPHDGFKEIPLEKAAAVEVATHKYWVFVDVSAINLDSFIGPWPWPDCDAEIFPVKCNGGKTVQDAVSIYKIGDEPKEAVR